jgi:hypothetical protein
VRTRANWNGSRKIERSADASRCKVQLDSHSDKNFKKSEAVNVFIDFQILSSVMSIGGMRLCAVLLVTLVNKIQPRLF